MNEYWSDIASALEAMLEVPSMPKGLKPMIVQAIVELRALKQAHEIKADPAVLEMLKTGVYKPLDSELYISRLMASPQSSKPHDELVRDIEAMKALGL